MIIIDERFKGFPDDWPASRDAWASLPPNPCLGHQYGSGRRRRRRWTRKTLQSGGGRASVGSRRQTLQVGRIHGPAKRSLRLGAVRRLASRHFRLGLGPPPTLRGAASFGWGLSAPFGLGPPPTLRGGAFFGRALSATATLGLVALPPTLRGATLALVGLPTTTFALVAFPPTLRRAAFGLVARAGAATGRTRPSSAAENSS
jgi:hypothetical protein